MVRNVASVVESYAPPRGAVARNAALDSIEGTILLRRGENPKDVLEAVHQAIATINREVLPPGMHIVPFYDRTRLVDTTLHTVGHNMLEGVALVTLVLWLFLARHQRLDRGGGHHAARAVDGIRGPLLLRRAGQPAVDGRHRLRHPARRGGHPGRERLPAPRRGAAAARECPRRRRARRQGGGAADPVLDVDHRRGHDADLHPGAGGGAHLSSGRPHLCVRPRGRAVLHDAVRPGADDGPPQEPQGRGQRIPDS